MQIRYINRTFHSLYEAPLQYEFSAFKRRLQVLTFGYRYDLLIWFMNVLWSGIVKLRYCFLRNPVNLLPFTQTTPATLFLLLHVVFVHSSCWQLKRETSSTRHRTPDMINLCSVAVKLLSVKALPAYPRLSCLHTIMASSMPHVSPQTVPHFPSWNTSTRPSLGYVLPRILIYERNMKER